MSVLQNQSQVNQSASLFAPAGSGGGAVGPNLIVSTLTGPAGSTPTPSFILLQDSDGSGRTQWCFNTADGKGIGTYPIQCVSVPPNTDGDILVCPLDLAGLPAGLGVGGGSTGPGLIVFNDPTGANDAWISGGGPTMNLYSQTNIVMSTPQVVLNSIAGVNLIQTPNSTITYLGPSGVPGGDIVMSWTNTNSAAFGIVAANNTDGVGIVADNGSCQMNFGGANGSITNVSSINGAAPALTSGTQSDVSALFSSLFAANPSLSTIVY